jgi:ubiquitin-like 1-activating enzyme E1 B
MAGNIIPAIATTNAIISGVIVLQALHLLRKAYTSLRNVHIQLKPTVPLSAIALSAPNKGCGVCRDTYVTVRCDTERTTLGEIVNGVLGIGESEDASREVSVYEDKRVLSDPDWEDNYGRTLESLNVTQGKFLSIVDEEGDFETIAVSIGALPCVLLLVLPNLARLKWCFRPNHPMDAPPFILPSPLPQPPRKTKPPPPALPSSPPIKSVPSLKRPAPDGDDGDVIEVESAPKRPRNNGSIREGSVSSPSKRRKLDEDGLLLMNGKDDKLEDEVIEID